MNSEDLPPVPGVLHKTSHDGTKVSYVIGEKAGSGGFGTVYAGEELPSHTPIAIKCISKTRITSERIKRKIFSEVDIQRSLHHPHIVEFRGVFQDDNYIYILMEYCPNGTLLDILRQKRVFSEDEAADYCRQILEGLVYLHDNHVIHRDLKLQNFLLDSEWKLKIADFGLSAKIIDDDEKRMTICGTPGYLSPEVIGHREGQTTSVDIWATGVCAFLMLTGHQPFQSKDKHQTLKKIRHVAYSWPENCGVSEVARNFVDCLLQRDPAMRPPARALLSHPFITRQVTGSLNRFPVLSERPLTLPSTSVRIWWDYSHRYGLAYLLHNSICGACFNDSTRILMTPDESLAQYWDSPQKPAPEIISMKGIEESPHRKKLLLIKYFASELKQKANELTAPPLRINMPTDVIGHVKYWARTNDGVLFRMANRDIQANFRDHTKLVIESASKIVYFDNASEVIKVNLSDLSDKEKYHEIRKRFAIVKEMAQHLV
ncbi:CAMK family protein kinase [Histomonas meleagridis]|uniref:CAMK family protein kinase n=1 Tax=Histomonas meleagridis TaxID=135588 RepID=UPI0035599901|nr:CAMK family protein kinase [Histomonas meleagridis]KAH0799925.1 CAMK family protein kinase [Histomonas meleagridis]